MTYQPFHPNFSPLPASSLANSGLGDPSHVSDPSFGLSRYHPNQSYDGHSAPNTLNQLSDGQPSSQQPRGLQYTPVPSQFPNINRRPPGSSVGPNEPPPPPLNQTQHASLNQSSIGHTSSSTRPLDHNRGLDIDTAVSPTGSSNRGRSNASSVASGDQGHPASSNGSQQGDQDPTSTSSLTVSSSLSGELQRLKSLLQIQLTPQLSQTIQQLAHLPSHLLSVAGLMIALSRPTANLEPSQQLSLPNHTQPFEFGNAIRVSHLTMLTTSLDFTVIKPELELFARENLSDLPERGFGIEAIEEEGSEFIKTHLPPGYASGEDDSISSVFELIKDTLRYERHH
ncbi:hypothetical protein PGT21_022184 [Puccinia graminis f. sp. tritici]|uniref:Uncharacterized protein n=1 Tax=Puccinia graminis f. sp. tritici TaxID=56615 RepID=A0A5B0MCM6_PUCGR|nr:hypothetical protein PGT21_022184 [Puccinia graminis f. sp. tritici]